MKLLFAIWKEGLILIRDKAGLVVLFLMPLALIILMALIQDAPFRDYKNVDIPVLIINNDQDSLGALIESRLKEAGMFKIDVQSESELGVSIKESISSGKYKAAIVIGKGATRSLKKVLRLRIEKAFSAFSPVNVGSGKLPEANTGVLLFFDPITKTSFREGAKLAVYNIVNSFEAAYTLQLVQQKLQKLSGDKPVSLEAKPAVLIKEENATNPDFALYGLNSVQHNVPAWAIFGIFFIVLPLAGNVIKEREQNTLMRIHLIPGNIWISLTGKILTYLVVAILQFVMVVLAGKFLMPLLGLPTLHTGDKYGAIISVVIALGLAAAGYGIFIGTVFKNHHQASTFGSVSIVILAAIGGIWIPVFVMPPVLQTISIISPLSWGMNAFNNIFLRGNGLFEVQTELFYLFSFCVIMLILSIILEKNKTA